MDQDTLSAATILWLFGALGAWLFGLTLWMDRMRSANIKNQVAIDLFISSLGEKIAAALHNDDDHLKIDWLLDKYSDPAYDMAYDEWHLLKEKCNIILEDKAISKLERSLCGIMAAVCEREIAKRYGLPKLNKA